MHFLIFKNASHFYYIRILSPIFIWSIIRFLKVGESQMKNIFLELFEQKSTRWPFSQIEDTLSRQSKD